MVSGIMSALNIAPMLHFVEPGLTISGEEWIKVMDEYIAPKCTALMEPGRKFFAALDSREFQPPCSPDLSPLDFILWNELKDTARSASEPCQSLRIAGTLDPRVSQNVDRQSLGCSRKWAKRGSVG